MREQKPETDTANPKKSSDKPDNKDKHPAKVKEIGGPEGPEPTRYGDWEVAGRCSDF